MKVTLNKRAELAKEKYDFSKGINWWWWLRIVYCIGVLYTLALPTQVFPYTNGMSDEMTIVWLAMILVDILYGYGIYTAKGIGYVFIIIYFVSSPILELIFNELFAFYYIGTLFMDSQTAGSIIGTVIFSIINIYYFYNRKILFYIDNEEKVVQTPKNNTNNSVYNTCENSYTVYADGNIEYDCDEKQDNNKKLLNTSKNSINGITIFFITTTVILASVVLLGIGFIIGSNSVNLESKAYKNGVYVTNSSQHYHTITCDFTKSWASDIFEISLSDAIKEGYTACPKCNP